MTRMNHNTLALTMGQALVWTVLWLTGMALSRSPDHGLALFMLIVIVPTGTAWGCAALIHTWRPRKLLNVEPRKALCTTAGVLSGMMAATLAVLSIWYFSFPLADSLSLACAPAMTTAVVLLLCSGPVRPGRCGHCDYDVRASWSSGTCPECGRPLRQPKTKARMSTTTQDHGNKSPIRV